MEKFIEADKEMRQPTERAKTTLRSVLRIANTKLSPQGKKFKERYSIPQQVLHPLMLFKV